MKLLHTFAACALVLSPLPVLAKDKPPISLARADKWEINYDVDSCHLLAKFGTGKQGTIVNMTRYQPSNGFDLTLIGELLKSGGPKVRAGIGFTPAFPITKREGAAGTSATKASLAIFSGLRMDNWVYKEGIEPAEVTPEQEAAVTAIDLALRGKTYRLETGSMAKPMQAMRTCLTDLVRHWGYDAAVQSSLSRPVKAIGNPGDWLSSSDYPQQAMWGGHNGLVQFRLDVDESGRIRNCRVLYRTNPDDFADLTCKLLTKRAKLESALDATGKPVKSYYIGKVRWMAWDN